MEYFWTFNRIDEHALIEPVVHSFVTWIIKEFEKILNPLIEISLEVRDLENNDGLKRYLIYVLGKIKERMLIPRTTDEENDEKDCRITSKAL